MFENFVLNNYKWNGEDLLIKIYNIYSSIKRQSCLKMEK